MKIWIDAQLPPALAPWLEATFQIGAAAVRDLGLRDASDEDIFRAATAERAVLMTKDRDFVELVRQRGSTPSVLWVTCGDTSTARLKEILARTLPEALGLLRQGEPLVEIGDAL